MSPESVERPREVLLRGDTDCPAGGDDAEEDARTMCSLAAPRDEHVEAQLGHALELALGLRVVYGHVGVVDEGNRPPPVETSAGGRLPVLRG